MSATSPDSQGGTSEPESVSSFDLGCLDAQPAAGSGELDLDGPTFEGEAQLALEPRCGSAGKALETACKDTVSKQTAPANPAHVREELERLAGMLDPPDVDKLVRAVLACAKPPDDAVKLKFLTQPHKEAVEGMCLRAASEEGRAGEGILVGLVGSEDEARDIIESLIEEGVWVEITAQWAADIDRIVAPGGDALGPGLYIVKPGKDKIKGDDPAAIWVPALGLWDDPKSSSSRNDARDTVVNGSRIYKRVRRGQRIALPELVMWQNTAAIKKAVRAYLEALMWQHIGVNAAEVNAAEARLEELGKETTNVPICLTARLLLAREEELRAPGFEATPHHTMSDTATSRAMVVQTGRAKPMQDRYSKNKKNKVVKARGAGAAATPCTGSRRGRKGALQAEASPVHKPTESENQSQARIVKASGTNRQPEVAKVHHVLVTVPAPVVAQPAINAARSNTDPAPPTAGSAIPAALVAGAHAHAPELAVGLASPPQSSASRFAAPLALTQQPVPPPPEGRYEYACLVECGDAALYFARELEMLGLTSIHALRLVVVWQFSDTDIGRPIALFARYNARAVLVEVAQGAESTMRSKFFEAAHGAAFGTMLEHGLTSEAFVRYQQPTDVRCSRGLPVEDKRFTPLTSHPAAAPRLCTQLEVRAEVTSSKRARTDDPLTIHASDVVDRLAPLLGGTTPEAMPGHIEGISRGPGTVGVPHPVTGGFDSSAAVVAVAQAAQPRQLGGEDEGCMDATMTEMQFGERVQMLDDFGIYGTGRNCASDPGGDRECERSRSADGGGADELARGGKHGAGRSSWE